MEYRKRYVSVEALYSEEGRIRPKKIYWDDGVSYEISRILQVEKRAALKVGGAGVRYTCVINGQRSYLFLEENQWFVEEKIRE